jgi:hypothetical protein
LTAEQIGKTGNSMKIGRLPWQQIPDDEFIESTRKTIRFMDMYRLWWILFNATVLVAGGFIFYKAMEAIMNLAGNQQLAIAGFFTGALFGTCASMFGHQSFFNIVHGVANFRAERLMLRYHDAINEIASQLDQTSTEIGHGASTE